MKRVPRNIVRQAIDLCDKAGFVKSWQCEVGIGKMVERCLSNPSDMWRTDNSQDWVNSKEAMNLDPSGVGVLVTKQMQTIAPLIGRVFVFDHISKRGIEGARLCLPQNVPAGFDPKSGLTLA